MNRKENTGRKGGKEKAEPKAIGWESQIRVPPNDPTMERAVLCSCLIDPNGIAKVIDKLTENAFYDSRNKMIYSAMVELFRKARPVDVVTVSEYLRNSGEIESIGGEVYLAELSNEVATSAHAESYAYSVQEKASLRDLILTSSYLHEQAFETTEVSELLDTAMSKIFDIYTRRQTGGFAKIDAVLGQTHEYLENLHRNHHKTITGIETGFDELDSMTSGFQRGDLIVLAARPSMGKTAFALDLARNAANSGVAVAFFSLEMNAMSIALRLLASEARINLHRLRSGRLPDSDWAKLSKATGKLSDFKIFIDDSGGLGINEVRARARRLKQQHDIGIVFIDYIGLMHPPKANNREQEVAQISRALKGLSRELNVPVVALSQLNRAVETRGGDKIPQLSDLRDSGSIEQDADLVMFIHRKNYYQSEDEKRDEPVDNTAQIIIRKQRNGPTGDVELIFNRDFTRFENKVSIPYSPDIIPHESPAEYNEDIEIGPLPTEENLPF